MAANDSERSFLFKIAEAYYLDGVTQDEVARRFGVSRIKVSRLLKRARELQIVRITVSPPDDSLVDLELRLADHFHLDECVVAQPTMFDDGAVLAALGAAAAPVLLRYLSERTILAVSWGRALSAVAGALPTRALPRATVVQMLGGLGRPEAETHGADITRRLAATLGARPRMLPSPGIVASAQVREALLADPQVADTLALAARADVALVGIGVPSDSSVTLSEGQMLTQRDLDDIRERGAVGDISLRYFDAQGQPLTGILSERVIGLEMAQIQGIPRVIGVAGGMFKLSAVRAALIGHLVDVLVTDIYVARRLLEEIEMGQL